MVPRFGVELGESFVELDGEVGVGEARLVGSSDWRNGSGLVETSGSNLLGDQSGVDDAR